MILTCTLLCDRKKSSQMVAIPRLAQLTHPDITLYVNIETDDVEANFGELLEFLKTCGKPYHLDVWKCESTWAIKPRFDQDQARLHPICIARNMSIQAAMGLDASHMLQVDADVVVPPDSVERLLALDRPLAGGLVGGRGAHAGAQYLSHVKLSNGSVVECEYATCGFVMISRELFSLLKYRSGPHNRERNVMLSEDPAYGSDAHDVWGFPRWTVDTSLKAEHWDDPTNPLTWNQGAQF